MRRMFVGLCLAVASLSASTAHGQIFYEPVQYQYEAYGKTFYYGGCEARVLDFAARRAFIEQYVRYGRHPFGGAGYGDNERFSPQLSVYTDFFPPYIDAANYGFTSSDARNEALRNRPRYFKKSDLLRSADVDGDEAARLAGDRSNDLRTRKDSNRADRGDKSDVPPSTRAASEPGRIVIKPYIARDEPTTKNARIQIIPTSRKSNVR